MRTARPPPLQNPKRGPHGGLRVHRRLVQPPSPPFRPRLSFTDQLRKDSANRKSNRKPNTVHRNGVAPNLLASAITAPHRAACPALQSGIFFPYNRSGLSAVKARRPSLLDGVLSPRVHRPAAPRLAMVLLHPLHTRLLTKEFDYSVSSLFGPGEVRV